VPVAPVPEPSSGLLWILTSATSVKARNVRAGNGAGRVSLCEVEGPHWVTVEGRAEFVDDAEVRADAELRYAVRFRAPRVNPLRVVILVRMTRVMGHLPLGTGLVTP